MQLPTLRETGGNAFCAESLPFLPGRAATAAVPPRPQGPPPRPVPSCPIPSRPSRCTRGGSSCGTGVAAAGGEPAPARSWGWMPCPAAAERHRALLTVSAAGPGRASSHASPPVPAGWATGSGGSPDPRMRPAPRARLGAAAGGFARRGWSRRERGRQPALPDLLGTARPDGVGCRRIAPGDASTGGCSGLGPVCNGIKHSSARTAAAGWGERGGSHGTGAAGRNTGENGVRACEWGVCVRVCVCVCVCVRGWEGVGRAWRGGGAAVVLGAGASVLTDALKKSRACQPGAVTCSHFK